MGWLAFDFFELAPMPQRAITSGLIMAQAVLALVLGGWYWARRRHDFISARRPYTLLAQVACVQLAVLTVLLPPLLYDPQYFCADAFGHNVLYPIVYQQCLLLQFTLACWRCLGLIQRFETQRLSAAVALRDATFLDSAGPSGGPDTLATAGPDDAGAAMAELADGNFFQRHLQQLQGRAVVAVLFVLNAMPTVLYFATPPNQKNAYCPPGDVFLTLFQFVCVAILLGLALKVRTIDDGLWIVSELKYEGVLLFVHVVVYTGVTGFEHEFHESGASVVYVALIYGVFSCVALGVPLWYSYNPLRLRTRRETGLTVPPELLTLQGVLSSKLARAAFQKHLMMEFSLENLLAVDDIAVLKRAKPRDDLPVTNPFGTAPVTLAVPATASTPRTAAAAAVGAGGHTPSLGARPALAIDAPPPPTGNSSNSSSSAPSAVQQLLPTDDLVVSVDQARELALAIYAKYVAAGAPFECNLPSRITRPLHLEFAALHRTRQRLARQQQLRAAVAGAASGAPIVGSSPSASSGPLAPAAGVVLRDAPPQLQLPSVYGHGTSLALLAGGAAHRHPRWRSHNGPAAAARGGETKSTAGTAPAAVAAAAALTIEVSAAVPVPPSPANGAAAAKYTAPPPPLPRLAERSNSSPHSSRNHHHHHLIGAPNASASQPSGGNAQPKAVVKNAAYFLAIFDDARAELLTLLSNDSLTRFVNSALFEQLLVSRAVTAQLLATSSHAPLPARSGGAAAGGEARPSARLFEVRNTAIGLSSAPKTRDVPLPPCSQ